MEALTTDESETDLIKHGPCPPEIVIYFCQKTATVTGFSEAVSCGFPFSTGLLFSHENEKITKITITSLRNNSENLVFTKPPMSVSVNEYWLCRLTGGACFFFYSSFTAPMLAMNFTMSSFRQLVERFMRNPAVFLRGAPGEGAFI
jgi:hypothetical protein